MKFLILINSARNYKYYFYELAKSLQEKGHEVYYALDSERSKYVEPLLEIDNNPNSFFFNKYFKENFDEDVKILNPEGFWSDYFYSDFDRFFFQNFNLTKKRLKYWENVKILLDSFFYSIIQDNDIDCVLYENISNSFAYAAYIQCEKLGKKYIGLMGARIPNCFEIQSSIIDKELQKLKRLRENIATEEEIIWYENYKRDITNIQPDYMKNNGLDHVSINRIFDKNKITRAIRFIFMFFSYDYGYDYQTGNPLFIPWKGFKVLLKRIINIKISKKYYIDNKVLSVLKQKEDFYVYPIHYHPESSTSVLAPEYTDEYTNIINISNNLPFGVYLYVKDHKSAKGIQSLNFYKKISLLPNVRLINYDVNIKDLILHSKGVITINSTAGYEALLLDKPVYLLGRVFYEEFNNVFKLNNFRELRNKIKLSYMESNPMDFIAYRRYCFYGQLDMQNYKYIDDVVSAILCSCKEG